MYYVVDTRKISSRFQLAQFFGEIRFETNKSKTFPLYP